MGAAQGLLDRSRLPCRDEGRLAIVAAVGAPCTPCPTKERSPLGTHACTVGESICAFNC